MQTPNESLQERGLTDEKQLIRSGSQEPPLKPPLARTDSRQLTPQQQVQRSNQQVQRPQHPVQQQLPEFQPGGPVTVPQQFQLRPGQPIRGANPSLPQQIYQRPQSPLPRSSGPYSITTQQILRPQQPYNSPVPQQRTPNLQVAARSPQQTIPANSPQVQNRPVVQNIAPQQPQPAVRQANKLENVSSVDYQNVLQNQIEVQPDKNRVMHGTPISKPDTPIMSRSDFTNKPRIPQTQDISYKNANKPVDDVLAGAEMNKSFMVAEPRKDYKKDEDDVITSRKDDVKHQIKTNNQNSNVNGTMETSQGKQEPSPNYLQNQKSPSAVPRSDPVPVSPTPRSPHMLPQNVAHSQKSNHTIQQDTSNSSSTPLPNNNIPQNSAKIPKTTTIIPQNAATVPQKTAIIPQTTASIPETLSTIPKTATTPQKNIAPTPTNAATISQSAPSNPHSSTLQSSALTPQTASIIPQTIAKTQPVSTINLQNSTAYSQNAPQVIDRSPQPAPRVQSPIAPTKPTSIQHQLTIPEQQAATPKRIVVDQKSEPSQNLDSSPIKVTAQPESEKNHISEKPPRPDSDKKSLDLICSTSKSDIKSSTPRKTMSAPKNRTKDGDNDSGVDESTQGNDRSPSTPNKKTPSKIPQSKTPTNPAINGTPKPTLSRSSSKSAATSKTPDSPLSTEKKKLPMNKIQVGNAPSPNLKVVKSKIGSLENATHKPGGGRVKIENKKIELNNVTPRIAAKNDTYTPGGGNKKIQQTKLQWNAKSKIGSLENTTHRPGGGDKKIETVKLDFKDKAKPKVASTVNINHKPGGGTVKIETQKLEIKATSKVGSLDNVKYRPGGGDVKIFDDKEYIKQIVETHHNDTREEEDATLISVTELDLIKRPLTRTRSHHINYRSPSPRTKLKKHYNSRDEEYDRMVERNNQRNKRFRPRSARERSTSERPPFIIY